jgi:hypothetical protein
VESTPTAENERVVSVTAAASEGMVAGVGAVLECLLNSPRYDNDHDDDEDDDDDDVDDDDDDDDDDDCMLIHDKPPPITNQLPIKPTNHQPPPPPITSVLPAASVSW